MTISNWLSESQTKLLKNGIESARLDSLILLEYCLSLDRSYLLANPSQEIRSSEQLKLNNVFNRRMQHEPIAYIRGFCDFYGYDFNVNHHVLVPRPETETMISLYKTYIDGQLRQNLASNATIDNPGSILAADIGTGCGAIGITLVLEVPNIRVDLIDNDPKALKVAKTNVDKFTLNISTLYSNLLLETTKNYVVLLCNLPYVPDLESINEDAKYEPKQAIFGGNDGLNYYRLLFSQINNRTAKPLYILTESLKFQHDELRTFALQNSYKMVESEGLIQAFMLIGKS